MSNKYNIHPALYIGGFAVFFSFIFGFPVGTLMGLAIGIGISKKDIPFIFERFRRFADQILKISTIAVFKNNQKQ